mgnify:CR=1 FL=1
MQSAQVLDAGVDIASHQVQYSVLDRCVYSPSIAPMVLSMICFGPDRLTLEIRVERE